MLPVPALARLCLFRRADGTGIAVGWSPAGPVRVLLRGTEVEVASAPRYFRLG